MNYEEPDTLGMYEDHYTGGSGPNVRRGSGPEMMGAETLVGNDVYDLADDDLGDVKKIMLEMRTGKVGCAVLSYGGLLGMGEKPFAVPWSALALDRKNKGFALNVEKARRSTAPGFDKNH